MRGLSDMMRYERYNAKRSERDVTTARVAPKGPQIVHSRRAYVCDGYCHPALTLPSLLSGQEPRSVSDRLRDFQTFFVKHEIGAQQVWMEPKPTRSVSHSQPRISSQECINHARP